MRHDVNLVCLFGTNGSGKTWLLRRIEELLGEGEVLRTGAERIVADLVDDLSYSGSIRHVSDHLLAIDHLLIDNLWVLASRPNAAAIVRDLIQSRMAADRFTVLASDLALDQWAAKQPEMADLLASGSMVVIGNGDLQGSRGSRGSRG